MIDFVEKTIILNDNQFGFQRNHCNSQAIIYLLERVANALDRRKIIVGLMIDLKKAFDGIFHEKLLKKLYAYGIKGKVLIGLIAILKIELSMCDGVPWCPTRLYFGTIAIYFICQ